MSTEPTVHEEEYLVDSDILLAKDIGCAWRHAYDPEKQTVRPFRSGYTNAECEGRARGRPLRE